MAPCGRHRVVTINPKSTQPRPRIDSVLGFRLKVALLECVAPAQKRVPPGHKFLKEFLHKFRNESLNEYLNESLNEFIVYLSRWSWGRLLALTVEDRSMLNTCKY